MKKLVAALATAGALAAGPALVAAPASATHGDYPPPPPTNTNARVPDFDVSPDERPRVRVRVGAPGNTEARGWVTIVIRNANGRVVTTVTRRYTGPETFHLPRLRGSRDGRVYTAAVRFKGHGFQESVDRVRFRVKRGA